MKLSQYDSFTEESFSWIELSNRKKASRRLGMSCFHDYFRTHLFLGGTQSTIDEVEEYFKKVDAVLSALRNADDSGDGGCSTENTDKNEETSIGRVEKRTKKKKNKSSPANVGEFKHEKETKGENKTNEATNQESSGNPEKEKSTAEEEK